MNGLVSVQVFYTLCWLSVSVCVFPPVYKFMCEFICDSLSLSVCVRHVSVHLCVCAFISLYVCVCVYARRARREACCSYISVQFVPDLKLKFHFQVVNCLPLRPLAHSELKFKLAWPCTAALHHLSVCLSLSLAPRLYLARCFALCPLISSPYYPLLSVPLISCYPFLPALLPLLPLLFPPNFSPHTPTPRPTHLPFRLWLFSAL